MSTSEPKFEQISAPTPHFKKKKIPSASPAPVPRASTTTLTDQQEGTANQDQQTPAEQFVLRLEASGTRPRVQWSADTVDNEHLDKKKSKCCCIYKKKRNWNESNSSDEDEECESAHCRGHVEKHRKPPPSDDGNGGGPGPSSIPT
uniref:E3 ubiquitin-protein ligase PPP1R11 n=1 Tax=Globodera pallida TaxID=36090 RepID=A0A183BS90_GLOPA